MISVTLVKQPFKIKYCLHKLHGMCKTEFDQYFKVAGTVYLTSIIITKKKCHEIRTNFNENITILIITIKYYSHGTVTSEFKISILELFIDFLW